MAELLSRPLRGRERAVRSFFRPAWRGRWNLRVPTTNFLRARSGGTT